MYCINIETLKHEKLYNFYLTTIDNDFYCLNYGDVNEDSKTYLYDKRFHSMQLITCVDIGYYEYSYLE